MHALQCHCDEPDEARERINTVNAQLDKLFYRLEATFFEKFVTALKDIYINHESIMSQYMKQTK